MSSKEITNLALKLGGIYIIVQTVLYLSPIVSSIYHLASTEGFGANDFSAILFLVTMAIMLIAGILLFKFSGKLADKELTNLKSQSLKNVLIAVAGLFIALLAVKDLPLLITEVAGLAGKAKGNVYMLLGGSIIESILELAGTLLQLIIGLFLFFKADLVGKLTKVK